MANAYFYSNIAVPTTLSGNINNSVTTATVGSTVGWPTSYPFIIAIDFGAANEELVSVTNNAAGTLTIVRGFGGTSAVSHSIGAVVRHVYNAQDATDFRTHEAATSSVHGVTGALVGATQLQTLTNKTLTSPIITGPTISGGGSLAGTFTGAPTLSGAVVFTGLPTFEAAASTTDVLRGRVTADANPRFAVRADGRLAWGPGTAVADTILYRDGANQLATSNTLFRIYRSASTGAAISTLVTGDSTSRFFYQADGMMFWGPGSATQDTNLYRNAANELKTDDNFSVGSNLVVTGTIAGAVSTATGITPASGWTVTTEIFRQTAGVKFAALVLSRTGATITNPGGADGNVSPDLQLLSGVPADWRPSTSIYVTAATGVNSGAGRANSDGTFDLTDWEPGRDIASGANMRLSWTFV